MAHSRKGKNGTKNLKIAFFTGRKETLSTRISANHTAKHLVLLEIQAASVLYPTI